MLIGSEYFHEIKTLIKKRKEELFRAFALFFRYTKYLRRHRIRIVIITGIILFTSLFGTITPLLSKLLVDRIIPDHDWSLFWIITIGYLVASFVMQGIGIFRGYLSLCLGQEVKANLSTTYIHNFLQQPYNEIQQKQAGAQIFRTTSDINAVVGLLTGFFTGIVTNIISLVVAIGIMLTLHWKVTIIFIVFVPLVFMLRLYISLRLRPLQKELREHNEAISAFLGGIYSCTKIIKIFGAETREALRYLRLLRENIRLNFRMWRTMLIYGRIQNFFESGVASMLQWWIWILVMKEYTTLGSAVAISWYFNMIIGPFMSLAGSMQGIIAGMVPGERIIETLSGDKEPLYDMPCLPITHNGDTIKFQDVAFSYSDDTEVLKKVSFELKSGTITALIGPSGSGKTTIINLICGLYSVPNGRIGINGKRLNKISVASLRKRISLVPQESFLFRATIIDNIKYSKRDANHDEVVRAAQMACIHDKIMTLSDKYNTLLEKGNSDFSAGEKQRIAIARAFLRDSPIFIFDEAFANLDIETESKIMNNLLKIKHNKIILIVSHRLKGMFLTDQAIAIKDGTVLKSGSPDELFGKDYSLKNSN
jgi:ABC-type bacteriocin/lantibiotic exporter with double-glycine peptidase domain